MKKIIIVALSLVMTSSIANTREYMHVAFESMISLAPYLASEKKFTDPNEEQKIYSHLDNLSAAFKGAHGQKVLSKSNYSPSLKVIRNHIEETKLAFSSKQKYFARNRLRATQALCMSCHTQMKSKASKNVISLMRANSRKFKNDFERAEILYLLRDYPSSIRYYLRYIDNQIEVSKKNKKYNILPEKNIHTVFKRIIHLYTKTFFKPAKAQVILEKYMKDKSLTSSLREDMRKWHSDLEHWKNKDLSTLNSISNIEAKYLSKLNNQKDDDISEVTLLVASGKILKLLNLKPNSFEVPLALYWLGRTDRELNFSYYYSMADVYLMDCMEKFPKSSVAKRCLKEYRSSIEMGYTGSAGTNIPKDLRDKLKKYEQLIGN